MNKIYMIVLAALLTIGAGQAQAYLYSWSAIPNSVEGVDAHLSGGQDILASWHATDGVYHFFRMDLRSAPSLFESTAAGNRSNFSGLYGIYIDKAPGGAVGNDPLQTYVPDSLTGIDNIIDSHFEPNFNSFYRHDYHTWNGGPLFDISTPFAVSQGENGGMTLEWAITVAELGGTEFTWWAVTHDIGAATTTYDQTGPLSATPVPLPAASWLLGSGVALLGGIRLRRLP